MLVNGEITACEDNTLTLEHIRSNTTVTVLFARNTYTVSLADGLTGKVFATLPVEYGEDAVLPEATPCTRLPLHRLDRGRKEYHRRLHHHGKLRAEFLHRPLCGL